MLFFVFIDPSTPVIYTDGPPLALQAGLQTTGSPTPSAIASPVSATSSATAAPASDGSFCALSEQAARLKAAAAIEAMINLRIIIPFECQGGRLRPLGRRINRR